MKTIKKVLVSINLIVVILTIITYANAFISPDSFFIFPVLGLFYPILFFANCFFIIFWLFQDVKWMIPSVICLLLGWNHISGFIGLNSNDTDVLKTDISVMSFNSHLFYEGRKKYKANVYKKVANYLSDFKDLDIICIQEFNFLFTDEILDHMKGYDLISHEDKRAIILSKYPTVNQGEIDFGTRTNSCIWADLVVEGDTIRVYSAHLQSSKISSEANQVLDNIDLQEKSTWKGFFSLLTKYRGSAVKRKTQAELIKAHIETCPYPVILTGDFNEPPTSYNYRILCENLKDTFREKAEGMESTYGGRIPFLRIDYIMTSNAFTVKEYNTLYSSDFSDHFPILSKIRLIQ